MSVCEKERDTQGVFSPHGQCPCDRLLMKQDKVAVEMSVNMVHSILSDSCGTAVFMCVLTQTNGCCCRSRKKMLHAASFGEAVTLDVSCAGHIKNDRPEKHDTRLAFHWNMDTQKRKDAERMMETCLCPLPCWITPASIQKAE